jgi:putative phosphoesterase
MRIGILSDTHDQVERTTLAVDLLAAEGVEILIHCGDLTGPDVVEACRRLTTYYVFGNNDFDEDALRQAIGDHDGTCLERMGEIEIRGRRIAVTHGDSDARLRRLAGAGPDYLLSGHTHRPADLRRGRTRWINPGALHRAAAWTVATLDLERDTLRILTLPRHP